MVDKKIHIIYIRIESQSKMWPKAAEYEIKLKHKFFLSKLHIRL